MKTTNKQLYSKMYHIAACMKKAPVRRMSESDYCSVRPNIAIYLSNSRPRSYFYFYSISLIFNGIHLVYSADTTGTVDMHTARIMSLLSSICLRLCSTNTLIHKYLPHSKKIKQSNKIQYVLLIKKKSYIDIMIQLRSN